LTEVNIASTKQKIIKEGEMKPSGDGEFFVSCWQIFFVCCDLVSVSGFTYVPLVEAFAILSYM